MWAGEPRNEPGTRVRIPGKHKGEPGDAQSGARGAQMGALGLAC